MVELLLLAFGCIGWAGFLLLLGPITLDRSLSVHMLLHLENGPLSKAEMEVVYPPSKAFEKRYADLTRGRFVQWSDGKMHLTARGRRAAFVYRAMKRFV